MQAVILAGGKGTRLKPYTTVLPKPLAPVGEYPILEIIIRQLKNSGIEDIIISIGHLPQLIESYFGDGKRFGVTIRYVQEKKPLGTAGAVGIIKGLEENFLVMNGDILTTLDYKKLFNYHLAKKGAGTISIIKRSIKDDYGVVIANEELELSDFIEKPTHFYHVSMGINVLNVKCVDYIKKDEHLGMPELFLRMKKNEEKVYCYDSKDFWLDIGRKEDFQKAQDEFEKDSSRFIK